MRASDAWHMGHTPGREFWKHAADARSRGLSRTQFLDEYMNPAAFRPELPRSNNVASRRRHNRPILGPVNLNQARALAKLAAAHIGGGLQIHRFVSADGKHEVNVGRVRDWPRTGLSTAMTVDLITTPLKLQPGEYELIASFSSPLEVVEQLVADAGLKYRIGDIPWAPGAVLTDGVAGVLPGLAARHLVAVDPVEPILALTAPNMEPPVRWLQLLAITADELEAVNQRGLSALLTQFRDTGVDLFDLERPAATRHSQ